MLKQREFCNLLIKKNLVKPYDVIKHSFCTDRMKNIDELRIENRNDNRICPTITVRADSLGVTVYG